MISKLIVQYENIELIKLEKLEDVLSNTDSLPESYLVLDANTPAKFLAEHKIQFNGALSKTKLLWITAENLERNIFDTTKIPNLFKKIELISQETTLLKKASVIYDFIHSDLSQKVSKEDSFIPLDLIYLNNLSMSPCNIFLKISDKKYVKIINADDDFQIDEIITKYASKQIKEFYINYNNLSKFKETALKKVFKFDKIKTNPVAHHLQVAESVLSIARDFGVTDFILEGIDETFSEIAREFNSGTKLKHFLEQIDSLKGTMIGTHSYLTAVFISLIGENIPWFNREIKKHLLEAAILHDIDIHGTGLEQYEFKNITEINELTSRKKDLVINHSHFLSKRLAKLDVISSDVITIIAKHHEGAGPESYPLGLHAPQLSPPNCLFNIAHQFTVELENVSYDYNKIDQVLKNIREHYSSNSFKIYLDSLEKELKRP